MEDLCLLVHREARICRLTVNRPERFERAQRADGAWNYCGPWRTHDRDPEPRVVILTGAGRA
jgi:enoyl-CoA hydratase/carnithine racemase